MEKREPIHRTDDQLVEMLDQSGTWVIHGGSHIFGVATTLRRALDKTDTCTRSGTIVTAIARPPPHRLFVFSEQISRVTKLLHELEAF